MSIKFSNNYLILIIFIYSGCSLIKESSKIEYGKNNSNIELKLPYNSNDYLNDGNTFYSIENAKGSNLSVLRNMVQMQAKVNLANALKFKINSITDQRQSGTQGQTTASFQQQASSVIDQSIEKMILLDSKTLRVKEGNQYDYWGVYKLDILDVVRNLNQQLGTQIKPEDLSVSQSN